MTEINYAESYAKQIATVFTKGSFVQGNVNTDYSFEGVRSINIMTPETVDLVDYDRTKVDGSRFGALSEVGDTIQTLTMNEDVSFNRSIDRGNFTDQQMKKKAGYMMKLQINERVTPMMDKHCFDRWTAGAGTQENVGVLDKSNIAEAVIMASVVLGNALVPEENRVMYIGNSKYAELLLCPEFLNLRDLGVKAIRKGEVGEIANMRVIKVPDAYLPSDVQFLITYKGSVLHPVKIRTARVLTEDSLVDGWIIQGRFYYDAFVLGAKRMGVYAALSAERTNSEQPNE